MSSLDLEEPAAAAAADDSYANCRSLLPTASVGEVEVRGFTLGTAADCLGLRHVDSIDEPDFRTACALPSSASGVIEAAADRRNIGMHWHKML